MASTTPPDPDEIEVSIFGPGRGECIVIHLGHNDWCIVDSCITRGESKPVALRYLESLGGDAVAGVKLIVASHWHDDHIRGLATLLRACPSAEFSCSIALDNNQFRTLVAKELTDPIGSKSGVKEFGEIFQLVVERADANIPKNHITPILAGQNKRLLHIDFPTRLFTSSVTALSPSDGLFRQTLTHIDRWANPTADDGSGVPMNDTSVVLWIEAGGQHILLGADLELKPHAGAGWLAVVGGFQGNHKASFYKVAHHGSPNGDCDEIWTSLLEENPHAVVTPYNSSDLPGDEDLERLKRRTSNLFLTARPTTRLPKRDSVVEKELRRVNRRVVELRPGHVRWRWKYSASHPSMELFEGAEHVA